MAESTPTTAVSPPEITLYWLNQSRSQRILWLLEELSLPYKLVSATRNDSKFAPPEAKEIHPLGKYPMVSVNGQILAESGLIVETLIERYGPSLQPERSDDEEYLRYRYFMHYSEGSFMPPLLVGLILKGIKEASVPFFVKPVLKMIASRVESSYLFPQYEAHFAFLESELKDREYLAGGKLTGADIMMSFPVLAAKGRVSGLTKEKYPSIFAYSDRIAMRTAYVKAKKLTEELEGPPL
ncbi:hypothetical protein K440DRAFT_363111 [Wilcoxina mikolae CBS 423.85]|nr:hypothetical protein K440DRAFT_363111 [Wilcoxina mikolae CBS 423.85]